jgi:hypothetical protein
MSAPRGPEKFCAYVQCGKPIPFTRHYWRKKFCDRTCATAARDKAARQEMGRKGGRTRGANAWPSIAARFMALAGTMAPWEAFRAGAIWQRKRMADRRRAELAQAERLGYARGWSDAIGEHVSQRFA